MTQSTATRTPPDARDESAAGNVASVEERISALQGQLDLLKAQVRQAQQLSSLGAAAATFAHEVNNLLTPILSYVRAASTTDNEKLRDKALAVTLLNVEMLAGMSENVLEISSAKPTKCSDVLVRDTAEAAQVSLCRDLSKDGIRFSVDVADSISVWCDALQLRQVLFNLFLNAREAMVSERKGRLDVTARAENDFVVIDVHNTGEPIPPELLPHIFDPLQSSKVADGNQRSRCSGLGLALCRDLIHGNGGTLTVTSDVDRGTTFTIKLPAHAPSS